MASLVSSASSRSRIRTNPEVSAGQLVVGRAKGDKRVCGLQVGIDLATGVARGPWEVPLLLYDDAVDAARVKEPTDRHGDTLLEPFGATQKYGWSILERHFGTSPLIGRESLFREPDGLTGHDDGCASVGRSIASRANDLLGQQDDDPSLNALTATDLAKLRGSLRAIVIRRCQGPVSRLLK